MNLTEINPALLDAVIRDDVAQVKVLLEQGADPNFHEDSALIRPLHFAALHNAVNVAPLLITAGADIHATTDSFETALIISQLHENNEFFAFIQRFYAIDCQLTTTAQ